LAEQAAKVGIAHMSPPLGSRIDSIHYSVLIATQTIADAMYAGLDCLP